MLEYGLDIQRANIVGDKEFPVVVAAVIREAEKQGWTPKLVSAALEKGGGNAKLQAFVKNYPEYSSTPSPEQVDLMTDTLAKTLEMLKGDLYIFKNSFENVLEKIDTLNDYKTLHDELHDMNVGLYSEIERETSRLPDGKDAKSNLARYDRSFKAKIDNMRVALARDKVDPAEAEWIKELDDARLAMKAAIIEYNKDVIDQSLQSIRDVLETQPTSVNKELWKAINTENDRLPELIDIMRRVCTAMKGIKSEADKVPRFENGITSLETLTAQLKSLVNEHDAWQEVEGKLQQIGDWLESDIPRFYKKWETIRAKIKPYYTAQSEEWALDFQQEDKTLEEAIRRATDAGATSEALAAARADAIASFNAYCEKASWRFYDVDKTLLGKCETLRKIRSDLP